MQQSMKKVIDTTNLIHTITTQYHEDTKQLEVIAYNENGVKVSSSLLYVTDFIPTPKAIISTLGVDEEATVSIEEDRDTNTWTLKFGIPRGEKGEKGDKGDKGDKGEDAVLPNISAEAVTLVPGSKATASVVKEDGTWKFKFGIPTGEGSSGNKIPQAQVEITMLDWNAEPYAQVETTTDNVWDFQFGIPSGSHVEIDNDAHALKIKERS